MRFDVLTLFPDMFGALCDMGVTGRAHAFGRWQLKAWNPRDFTHDVHRTVDDRPYGGGPGMVMMAQPLLDAVQAARRDRERLGHPPARVVLLSPAGSRFGQATAQRLAHAQQGVILVCGRYEGIDQRFIDQCVDEQWSLGDFVLSGGELAAMAMIDATVRLLPGVLGDADSALQDSFHPSLSGLLDSPHYTRPEQCSGAGVPAPLLSGHHERIARWRREQSLMLSASRRPDLIVAARQRGELTREDEAFLVRLDKARGETDKD